uniref:Tail protein n=1 Tax=viral metagenome TaxID=1070528 RepID=A0A6M3JTC1_9ZZZZ
MSVRNDIIANLKTSLEALKTDSYAAEVHTVESFHVDYVNKYKSQTPVLMIIDQGNDERLVYDNTNSLFAFDVQLWGYSSDQNYDTMQKSYNDMVASIKQWIYSNPSLGSYVRDVQFVAGLGVFLDQTHNHALVQVQIRILYYCVNGSF